MISTVTSNVPTTTTPATLDISQNVIVVLIALVIIGIIFTIVKLKR